MDGFLLNGRNKRQLSSIFLVLTLLLWLTFSHSLASDAATAKVTRNDGIARIEVVGCQPLARAMVDGTNQYGKSAHWDSAWAKEFHRGDESFQTWNWWWTGQVQIRM